MDSRVQGRYGPGTIQQSQFSGSFKSCMEISPQPGALRCVACTHGGKSTSQGVSEASL